MERAEALRILGAIDGSSEDDLGEAYVEKKLELDRRIAAAPTGKLKAKYAAQIEQLDVTLRTLGVGSGEGLSAAQLRDLPSLEVPIALPPRVAVPSIAPPHFVAPEQQERATARLQDQPPGTESPATLDSEHSRDSLTPVNLDSGSGGSAEVRTPKHRHVPMTVGVRIQGLLIFLSGGFLLVRAAFLPYVPHGVVGTIVYAVLGAWSLTISTAIDRGELWARLGAMVHVVITFGFMASVVRGCSPSDQVTDVPVLLFLMATHACFGVTSTFSAAFSDYCLSEQRDSRKRLSKK